MEGDIKYLESSFDEMKGEQWGASSSLPPLQFLCLVFSTKHHHAAVLSPLNSMRQESSPSLREANQLTQATQQLISDSTSSQGRGSQEKEGEELCDGGGVRAGTSGISTNHQCLTQLLVYGRLSRKHL